MKIAHFLAYYPSPCGTTKSVGGLARALAKAGQDVDIWTYDHGESGPDDDAVGVRVLKFKGNRMSRFVPPGDLRAFISAEGPGYDLVVLHGMFNPQLAGLAFLLKRKKIPYLVCPHGTYHPDLLDKNSLLKTLYKPLELYVLNHSAGVQVFSHSQVTLCRNFGVKAPVFVIPNGCDPDEVRHQSSATGKSDPSKLLNLLFLGRIDTQTKSLDTILTAIASLPEAIASKMLFTLIGPDCDGNREKLKNQAICLGIQDRVQLLEAEYGRPPVDIIADYDVLILASRHEGFGFSALEAMLAETPLLISDQAGMAEHVKNAQSGWVVSPAVDSIATGITTAIAEKNEWQNMGKNGRHYALENLSWDAVGKNAAAIYRQLIPSH